MSLLAQPTGHATNYGTIDIRALVYPGVSYRARNLCTDCDNGRSFSSLNKMAQFRLFPRNTAERRNFISHKVFVQAKQASYYSIGFQIQFLRTNTGRRISSSLIANGTSSPVDTMYERCLINSKNYSAWSYPIYSGLCSGLKSPILLAY